MARLTEPGAGEALRCLAVTSLFPRSNHPARGIFILQRLQALARRGAEVRVLSPVPWVPPGPVPARYASMRSIPRAAEVGGLPVLYPRYPMIPKISMSAQAWGYARGITPAVRDALRTWRPQLIDAHYLYPDACAAARVARRFGLPYVCTARGSDVKRLSRFPRVRRQIRTALAGAAAVMAVSHDLAEEMRSRGLTDRTIDVIPNGIDGALFHPGSQSAARRDLGLGDDVRHVVCVAGFDADHGHELLVRALAQTDAPSDVELHLVGDGPVRPQIEALARSLGVHERVHLVGAIDLEQVPLWFRAADASALMADRAGCPNVVLESLACGTPCLVSDLPEMREVMPTSRQGVLVARTPAAVAQGVREILAGERTAEDLSAVRRTWDDVAEVVAARLAQVVVASPQPSAID